MRRSRTWSEKTSDAFGHRATNLLGEDALCASHSQSALLSIDALAIRAYSRVSDYHFEAPF